MKTFVRGGIVNATKGQQQTLCNPVSILLHFFCMKCLDKKMNRELSVPIMNYFWKVKIDKNSD